MNADSASVRIPVAIMGAVKRDKLIHEYFGVNLKRVWDTPEIQFCPKQPSIEK
jgi:uncharacterized protein with HEPN domain